MALTINANFLDLAMEAADRLHLIIGGLGERYIPAGWTVDGAQRFDRLAQHYVDLAMARGSLAATWADKTRPMKIGRDNYHLDISEGDRWAGMLAEAVIKYAARPTQLLAVGQ